MVTLAEHLKGTQPRDFIGMKTTERNEAMLLWFRNIRHITKALGNTKTSEFLHRFRKACGFYNEEYK